MTETTIVRRLAGVLAVATILILPAAASAQAARDLRTACEADAKKFCAEEKPGGGRILQCLKSHEADLAPACKSALDAAATRIKDRRSQ